MGWSEEKKSIYGGKYIEHHDDQGKKIGESFEKEDWFGNTYYELMITTGTKLANL